MYFGTILASFWIPFGSQSRLQGPSRLLLGDGVPPQGRPRAFGASQSIQKSILRDPKAPKEWAPKMDPWTVTELPKSAPGSHSDPGKRPEARRRPRGPQDKVAHGSSRTGREPNRNKTEPNRAGNKFQGARAEPNRNFYAEPNRTEGCRRLPKVSEGFRRFPKVSEGF